MKRLSLIAAGFVLAALSAASAYAQAPATQPAAPFRMAVINTQAFDDPRTGITRYTAALTALEQEFKPLDQELQGMVTKYQNLAKEIETLRTSTAPVNQSTIQAKVDEYETLGTQIKRKQEDARMRLERRQPQVLGPIQQEIGKALQEYAKQKGYALILDVSKLAGDGTILAWDEAKVDVTKDFIQFFNSRPAAAVASTTTPK